jgi:hypothetical protein
MNELVTMISEKLGISPEVARKAVLISADYMKTKLSPAIYNEVELVLETSDVSDEETRELGLFQIP